MARILVVDDEANIRMMLRLALAHVGHVVETADDGLEALARFGSDGVGWDLVLLDQRMPGMDGIEALHAMHARRPDIRVIMITAFGTIDLATEAMRVGVSDFLRKPFTVEVLRGAVEAALRGTPPPTAGRDASPLPFTFERTTVNGYHVSSAAGLEHDRDGSLRDTFTIRDPRGKERQWVIILPAYVIELVRAHADRDDLPGGDRFWQALCGEALANYLWQNAEPPAEGMLRVEDLTSGLRHWIDSILAAGMLLAGAGM